MENAMPTYEYLCQKCQNIFTVVLTMSEHGQGQVKCPQCKGHKVTQQFSTFYVKTSKKS
jgi:putative FmdB family regulatory protein